jgi:hypothetical protein
MQRHSATGVKRRATRSWEIRDEPERPVALEADDREIPAAGGEHGPDVLAPGELQARGFVTLPRRGDRGRVGGVEREEAEPRPISHV